MPNLAQYLLLPLSLSMQKLEFLRLRRHLGNPEAIQRKLLQKILRQNCHTTFGVEHQFSSLESYEQYSCAVKIRTPYTYGPLLKACHDGNHEVISPEKPAFFAMTAGSTGQFKYIPISRATIRETRRSILAFNHYLSYLCPPTRHSPIQFIVGSAEGPHSPDGIPAGFMSGFNYKNLPAVIRQKFVVPYWVFTLENAADRYYAIARFLASQPALSAIGAFSPVNISNVARFAIDNLHILADDIANGTLTMKNTAAIPHTAFRPDPALATRLREWLAEPGNIAPVDYPAITGLLFPAVKLAVCWQGGNMGYAAHELRRYFPAVDILEMPFSASEGVFAIPFRLNQTGGIAAITSHFLEFIPESCIHDADPAALPVWAIEQGKYYYLVITTSGGLYRYCMEDLVHVKGFEENTPVIEFVAKLQRQVSISNERLNEHDVVNAVLATIAFTGQDPGEFVMMPTRQKHYRLLCGNPMKNLQDFADKLELELCRNAKGYAFEREDCLLDPVVVAQTANGELEDYIQSIQQRASLPNAQFKPVHLCNDFDKHTTFTIINEATAA